MQKHMVRQTYCVFIGAMLYTLYRVLTMDFIVYDYIFNMYVLTSVPKRDQDRGIVNLLRCNTKVVRN